MAKEWLKMEKLSSAWTERIFERLKWIFKDRWTKAYERSDAQKILFLGQWSTGLSGLTANEIRRAITILECYPHRDIPTVIEFYHYAKGNIKPMKPKPERFPDHASKETAKIFLKEIRARLRA